MNEVLSCLDLQPMTLHEKMTLYIYCLSKLFVLVHQTGQSGKSLGPVIVEPIYSIWFW